LRLSAHDRSGVMRLLCAILALFVMPGWAKAACLPVGDDPAMTLSNAQVASLSDIGFGRPDLFQALAATAEFETVGCWAGPVGNFDAQTLSVGILQWNYGQNSLQGLMNAYKASFSVPEDFSAEISALMPQFGSVAFGEDCLVVPLTATCKEKVLAAHDAQGKLTPAIASEYEALFNSPRMRQIQIDTFVTFLAGLKPKLTLTFGEKPTALQTRWGIDLAIQQGYVRFTDPVTATEQSAFLNPTDAATVRRLSASLTPDMRTRRMMSALRWYSGLCGGIYQGVVAEQCNYNIKHWCAVVVHGVTDEQFDLMNLTFVRSRIATGQSGRWQANAFARRTKIVLGTGQVGPNKLALPQGVRRTRRCNALLIRE
jgi:hypothetical protein